MLKKGWLSHELTHGQGGEQVDPFNSSDADGLQAVLLPSPS